MLFRSLRSHERGMSAGDCANTNPSSCRLEPPPRRAGYRALTPRWLGCTSIVRPWNVPEVYAEINRASLQQRSRMVPYLYTATRQAYDTGVCDAGADRGGRAPVQTGILASHLLLFPHHVSHHQVSPIRPMYYDFPTSSMAYSADQNGNFAQYMFGDDMIVAPVVAPADSTQLSNVSNTLESTPCATLVIRGFLLTWVGGRGGFVTAHRNLSGFLLAPGSRRTRETSAPARPALCLPSTLT